LHDSENERAAGRTGEDLRRAMRGQGIATMPFCRSIKTTAVVRESRTRLALQLPFLQISESMGNHDSKIMDAASVD